MVTDTLMAGKIVRKRVVTLQPSPENELLYGPVENDPDIPMLAESIQKSGLLEMIVITNDNFIISGHRRHYALLLIGRDWCKCRVLAFRRDSMPKDDYIALLRDPNRQRNKSIAAQVKEALVDIDPGEAYANLCEQRSKSVYAAEHNGVQTLHIEGRKVRHPISEQLRDHVKYIKQIVFEDRRDYWPLSIRGVHYPLLNFKFMRNIPREIPYLNDDGSYDATSQLISRLRVNTEIPWEAFDDTTRPFKEFRPFNNVREFIHQQTENLFGGYWRNLLQSQPNHIEVLVEKNTVYHMVLRVTKKYQIPTMSGRGFCSLDPYHDMVERYQESGKERLIVIALTDHDPEGEQILQVAGRTLRDDFGVQNCDIFKAGVTREQIEKYNLPSQNFAKESSSNHKWFVDRNGGDDAVYELEALEPQVMLDDLERVIQGVIDIDLFNREVDTEKEDAAYLEAFRKTAKKGLKDLAD